MENNNHDIKLCPSCGAKNKSAYKYCNECGTALNQSSYSNTSNNPASNNIPSGGSPYGYGTNGGYYGGQYAQNSYTPNYIPYGMNMHAPYDGTPDFNGVSAKDVYDFTGEKPELFNKLRIQHFSGKTGPYCWPLFFLGIIFGFFGMGCWYLYRKMYKPAAAFFAGVVAQLAAGLYVLILTFTETLNNFSPEFYNSLLDSIHSGEGVDITAELMSSGHPTLLLLDSLLNMASLASFVLAIVLPFFAYRQYKNFALKKIRAEYNKAAKPQFTVTGGTRGGLVGIVSTAYGVIIFAVVFYIMSWFLGGMYEKLEEYAADNSGSEYYEQMPFDEMPFDFDDPSGGIW